MALKPRAQQGGFWGTRQKCVYTVETVHPKSSYDLDDDNGRCLWILGTIYGFIGAVLFIVWSYSNPRMGFYAFNEGWASAMIDYSKSQSFGTCSTPEYVRAASEIIQNMSRNKSISPCVDFEEMVCGGWRERHYYRPNQETLFTSTLMEERSQLKLQYMLQAGYPEESKHSEFSPARLSQAERSVDKQNFNKLKTAYESCMDTEVLDMLGAEPLLRVLRHIASLFPVQPWATTDAAKSPDVRDAILNLARLGVTALASPHAEPESRDADTVIISVAAPSSVGLPVHEQYVDGDLVQKYHAAMSKVLSSLSPRSERGDADRIVELEKKLAGISQANTTLVYNSMSLDDADALCPEIDLRGIVTALAAPSRSKVERVIVKQPEYFENLSRVLRQTRHSTLQQFFIWKAIQSLGEYVKTDALLPWERLLNEIRSKEPDMKQERWRTCISHVDAGLGWIASRFFIEAAFSQRARDIGDHIVSHIKEAIVEKLKAAESMDKEVIDLAVEKVRHISHQIGYPTANTLEITNPELLANYYKNVDVVGSSHFANAVAMRQNKFHKTWDALSKPVDRNQWVTTTLSAHVYYNPSANQIVLPACVMQPPLFDVAQPQYLNYGALGSIAGRELADTFDPAGEHGGRRVQFDAGTRRLAVQPGRPTARGVSGDQAPAAAGGADGVGAANAAWTRHRSMRDWDLPGLERRFTHEQLFFVAGVAFACGGTGRERGGRVPALGAVAGLEAFREAFKCPVVEPTYKP